ncbi:ParA family protein [Saccharophagus degradans]|uniref:Putative partition-related protein n=1 Tax=Saccharophagus degradans (strain 2-40 / ATCC 43961 / DSM 17024) TaxID=203122 RepID=Q21G09_SACD2|nr:ParA family protein [Saccharophagus degradans]ABD82370.1 putative partition-related protein [Saccharophagus degradans 2-40]
MGQIFIANPKGGCGKTTVAVQLAGFYANMARSVQLVDHDAQRSSLDWASGRPATCAPIKVLVSANEPVLADATYSVTIHDMPAAWTLDNVDTLIHPQDIVIIPLLASPTDIKACLRFVMGIYRSGLLERGVNIGIVANRVRKNTRYFKVLEAFLAKLDIPLITVLRDSQNYVRAMDRGLTLFDLPAARCSTDRAQWQPLLDWSPIANC